MKARKQKNNEAFFCSECGTTATGWLGRCPGCGHFNTFVKAPTEVRAPHRHEQNPATAPVPFSQLKQTETKRWDTGLTEVNRVLGGGLVPGSLVLLGGVPGIGKSTLLLQVAAGLGQQGKKVLYASGEESVNQIALRARRLGIDGDNLSLIAENNLEVILNAASDTHVIILDSIQAVYHPDLPALPGTISQIRECTAHLVSWAKSRNQAVFIVGHVTKEGTIAGPRLLEHMVDTVLYFEGEEQLFCRMVRAIKNRFGSANELGLFRMGEHGLEEVLNPAELFISDRKNPLAGTATGCILSGSRPLLCEIQALAMPTVYGNPRRVASGVDYNRLLMILAVLERRAGIQVATRDIYVSVVGGLRLKGDPGADLAIALAIVSHLKEKALPPQTFSFGELALSGEIRQVLGSQLRTQEGEKLGSRLVFGPHLREVTKNRLDYKAVTDIRDALRLAGLTKGGD